MSKPYLLLPLTGSLLLLAGCSAMRYDQLPGPTHDTTRMLAAVPGKVCDAVAATAGEMKLYIDDRSDTPNGCMLELSRRPPAWLPGDDGERLRIHVTPAADGSRLIASSRRVAPGQVWIESVTGPLLAAVERRTVGAAP